MIVKNQRLSLTCARLGAELEGICEHEGQTVFVAGALPGEEVEALAMRVEPRYAFAKLTAVRRESPQRQKPACPVYDACGGCSGQHMRYEATLAAKRRQVMDCLGRIGGFSQADVPPVLGAENPFRCRNKTALPVGGSADAPQLGFYRRRSHRIVPIDDCPVAMEGLDRVISAVRDWMRHSHVRPYDERTHEGALRHVVVRSSRNGGMLALLVTAQPELPGIPWLCERLRERAPGFCALHQSVHTARNNVILGNTSQKLYGEDFITETLLGLEFEISPLSFFQVNPGQTEKLYQRALDFAELGPTDTVVDAYAGAGTIALCMARKAARVIGIEIVPQAVDSARRNAKRNHVGNAEFYAAAVEDKLPALMAEGLRPDVVVLDPPRKGVEKAVVDAVAKAAPRRVLYVSCYAPTQARDMALLRERGYRLLRCQPVDMFCYAGGVENVCVMGKEE